MLGLQGEDLVVGLFITAGTGLGLDVKVFDRLRGFLDLRLVAIVDAVLDALLLAHHVNLFAHATIRRFQRVELSQRFLQLVLKELDFGLLSAHLSGGRTVLLETGLLVLLLCQLVFLLVF